MSSLRALGRLRQPPPRIMAGIILSLIAAFSFATAGFIASLLVGPAVGGVTVAFFEALFGVVLVFGLRLGVQARMPRSNIKGQAWPVSARLWLVLAAIATALGFGGFYSALNYEGLSIVAPVTGATPLISYALILVLLRGEERLTRRVVVGAVMVVAGVILIGLEN